MGRFTKNVIVGGCRLIAFLCSCLGLVDVCAGLVKQLPEGHPDKVAAKQLLDNLDRVVR
jgi:hypothetical protein